MSTNSPSIHIQMLLPPAKKGLTQSLPLPNMFHHKLVALVGLVDPKFLKLSALSNYMA